MGQEIAGGVQIDQEPQPGPDLELTIDRQMQFQTQVYLRQAVAANHAKGGTVIVMDPRTGEIYAMATYPSSTPTPSAPPTRATLREPRGDRHLGAGLGEQDDHRRRGALLRGRAPDRHVPGGGDPHDRGVTIHDAEPHGTETMTLGDIIAHSSNVGISSSRTGSATNGSSRRSTPSGTGRRPASASPARRRG